MRSRDISFFVFCFHCSLSCCSIHVKAGSPRPRHTVSCTHTPCESSFATSFPNALPCSIFDSFLVTENRARYSSPSPSALHHPIIFAILTCVFARVGGLLLRPRVDVCNTCWIRLILLTASLERRLCRVSVPLMHHNRAYMAAPVVDAPKTKNLLVHFTLLTRPCVLFP